MKIFLVYSEIQPATLISLRGYEVEKVKVDDKYGYSRYLKQRWKQRESFINIEHDSVLWPGAIESLENCISPWCAFDYSQTDWAGLLAEDRLNSIPMGGVKLTSYLIDKTPGIWDEPVDWRECDVHLFKQALAAGLKPHQHFPGIVNANPVLLV